MAELNISERQAGDVTVLDMNGKITIGEGSVALRTAIRRLLEEGKKRILLNLAGVGYIDSSGIGELVSSYTAINKENGQLIESHAKASGLAHDYQVVDGI
jgi:anti-sigma B factor antagonist